MDKGNWGVYQDKPVILDAGVTLKNIHLALT